MSENEARREIVEIGRKLYERGYVVATDGNISARLDDGRLIFTPTGKCKSELQEDELVVMHPSDDYSEIAGLTSEAPMHLEVYRRRKDVNAVIHSHPSYTLALNLAGLDLKRDLLPELILTLGEVPIAPFATPCTPEGSEAISGLIEDHNAIILYRHGALTVGASLMEAFQRLERLEFAAKVTYLAHALAELKPLTGEQIEKILKVRERLGM